MPSDPGELMLLATHVNGLGGLAQPWHLKASYQTYDANGKPKDQGTFEEWWAAPDRNKISYSGPSLNQVQYTNDKDIRITGDNWERSMLENMVERYLVHPFPDESVVKDQKYIAKDIKAGGETLRCMQIKDQGSFYELPLFCVSSHAPVARLIGLNGGIEVLLNDVVRTDGHYAAKKIRVERAGKPMMDVSWVSLESFRPLNPAFFAPPASAVPLAETLEVGPGVMAGHRIEGDDPRYPPDAKAARIQGTVLLEGYISTEGTMEDLSVISGPPLLQEEAVNAVYTWRYTPYTLNGHPVRVKTQITVVFTLAR